MQALRQWLNRNSASVTLGAVGVLVLALGVILLQQAGDAKPKVIDVYYYDMTTGKLFLGSSADHPPIDAPGGTNRGVRAYVFACGSCADESKRFIGWLEIFTPSARTRLRSQDDPAGADLPAPAESWNQSHWISKPGTDRWVSPRSAEGLELMDDIHKRCRDRGAPRPCYPGRS